jgi:hypothetical protein
VADRYYRHVIGYTPDQLRAARQIRIGRSAAATSYLVAGLLLIAKLSPTSLLFDRPESLVSAINAIGFGLFAMAAGVVLLLGVARKLLVANHAFHARCVRWSWGLVPLGIAAGLGGSLVGMSGVVPVLMVVAVLVVAVADANLRRTEVLGLHMSPRVCVINLDRRTRTWHTEAELAAMDAAAQAVATEDGESADESPSV